MMHKIARNTVALMVGQAATVAGAILFGLLVARRLGPETYGVYSLSFAVVGMFTVLFTLGIDQIVVREVARQPGSAESVLRTSLSIRLAALPVAIAIIVLAGHFLGYDERQQFFIALTGLATGLSLVSDLPRLVFQGLQRMALDTTSRVVEKGVALLVAGICLSIWPNLAFVLVALIVGAVAGLLTSLVFLRRVAITSIGLGLQGGRDLLGQSAPLLGSLAIIGVTSRLPQIVLSFSHPTVEVGLYSAAFSLVDPFSLVSMAAATALLPVVSGLLRAGEGSIGRLSESMLASALLLSLPVTASLALFSRDLLSLVYGSAYAGAYLPMTILALSLLCYSLSVYLHIYLIAAGAQGRFLLVTMIQLAVSAVANLLLARHFGAVGTAASVALTQLSGLLLIARFTSPLVEHHVNRKGVSAGFATIAMVAGVMAARSLSFWLRAPLAVCLYAAGLLLTGGVTPGDIRRGCALIASLLRPSDRSTPVSTYEKV